MPRLAVLFVALCLSWAATTHTAHAQATQQSYRGPDLAAQRAAIGRLAPLVGQWSGEANVVFPEQRRVHQTEHVETALDGLLLIIRGAGYANASRDSAPIFRALAIVSYNDQRQIYEFRAYNEGRAVTAEARFLEDGRLQWTMNFAPVLIRYTITFSNAHWSEIGEMSRDNGATWQRTLEMNLSRAD